MTNYEKIKAMSVEEMARFLINIYEEGGGIVFDDNITVYNNADAVRWLNMGAEE